MSKHLCNVYKVQATDLREYGVRWLPQTKIKTSPSICRKLGFRDADNYVTQAKCQKLKLVIEINIIMVNVVRCI